MQGLSQTWLNASGRTAGGSGEDRRAGGDGDNRWAVLSSLRVKAQHTVGNRNPIGDVWEEERSHTHTHHITEKQKRIVSSPMEPRGFQPIRNEPSDFQRV
ncbi:hypothetical protein PIB30_012817 [Stylosanthes scabra]|uniref:Uncharacterized protein n=1 Tax=Stylosanthes scabra TaxID=79078 RepID=A0ABU6U503_9FABA|nr:hypothetical protein [Stylosanthes scabra]